MNKFIFVALITVASVACLEEASTKKEVYDLNNAKELYENYIKKYNKQYKDEDDKAVHFEAFKESLKRINEVNTGDYSHTAGLNDRSDYTDEEVKNSHGLLIPKGL